ncbi:MAG: DUF2461 domain-containing protein [Microthrixaceae bacterium]
MGFSGFGKGAVGFFEELAANNARDWWLANRARYDTEVRGPLEALLEDLAGEFGEAKVFRPNRDTRFSSDKSPYKTNAAAVASEGDGTSLYISLSAEGLHVGGGAYHLQRDQLARYRAAVADDRTGTELEDIAAGLRTAKAEVTGRSQLKTAPRGFSAEHPRIDLLRQDGLIGIWAHPPRAWLHTTGAADRVAEGWRRLALLNGWLRTHVGATTLP